MQRKPVPFATCLDDRGADHGGSNLQRLYPGLIIPVQRRTRASAIDATMGGPTAAKRLDDGKSELVKNFDPTAEETLFIPRLEGG
jgi:hypothetical protein